MFRFLTRKKDSGFSELFFRTDIHSHICPGIDDGSESETMSVEIVRGMAALGVDRMIVTPHVTDEIFENNPATIGRSFARLTEAVREAGLKMSLEYSAEYRIDHLTYSQLTQGDIIPLPGNFLLVECGWWTEPIQLDRFIFELQTRFSLHPILAHPERYPYYQQNRERYKELRRQGVMFQCNLLSLAGYYNKSCKQTAEWLLENDMVDLVGSDAHRPAHIEAIRRYVGSADYLRLYERRDTIKNDTLFGPYPNSDINQQQFNHPEA